MLCYNRGLASFLRRRVAELPPGHQPTYTGTFADLGHSWGAPEGAEADSQFWERRLPEEMARLVEQLPPGERFHAIVVDEAQDFFSAWWPPLVGALREPDAGGIFLFVDEGQRVFDRKADRPGGLLPVVLEENLRNTRQIADTFASLAAIRLRAHGADGPPVRFIACPTAEAVERADDAVVALLDDGWPAPEVALLTTRHRHPEQVNRQARGPEAYWTSFWEGDDVFYGHVLGFKGLERRAVVLALNGFKVQELAREMLYVGLSRARDLLVVCGEPDLVRRVGGDDVLRQLDGRC